jgi:hypothetical protein
MTNQFPPDFSKPGPSLFWKDLGYLLSRFVLITLALGALSSAMTYSLDQTNRTKEVGGNHLPNIAGLSRCNTRSSP